MDHKEFKRKPNKLLAAVAGVVMAASTGGAMAATTASKVDLDFNMECSFPLVGTTPVKVSGEADVPAQVDLFVPISEIGIRFVAELNAQTVGGLNVVGLGFLGGEVDVTITVEEPASNVPINLTIPLEKGAIPTQAIPAEIVKGTGKAPVLTFFDPGTINVYIDGITTKIEGFERDGSPANGLFNKFTDDCTMERYLVRTVQAGPTDGPGIGISTTNIDFGKVAPGTSTDMSVMVSSTGSDALSITGLEFSGSDAFSGSENCLGTTLSKGQTCTIDAVYTAPSNGTQTGTISISSNAGTATIAVSGTAGKSGSIDVFENISFGLPEVGEVRSEEITIGNSGNDSLNINGINLSGDSDFVLVENDCSTVAVGESCVAVIVFTPSSEGAKSATLTVNSNDPDNGSVAIALAGSGASANTGTGDTKRYIALEGEGEVQINTVSSGKAPLTGFFDGTIDRADGGILFDMALDDTNAKLVGIGFLPLLIEMSFVQTQPIVGEFVNSEMAFDAFLDVYLRAIKLRFFGFGIPIAGGRSCKISKERSISFKSVGKVNLAGGITPINGPLRLANVEKCGPLNIFVNAFVTNLGDSPIDLDLRFVEPAL